MGDWLEVEDCALTPIVRVATKATAIQQEFNMFAMTEDANHLFE